VVINIGVVSAPRLWLQTKTCNRCSVRPVTSLESAKIAQQKNKNKT